MSVNSAQILTTLRTTHQLALYGVFSDIERQQQVTSLLSRVISILEDDAKWLLEDR